MPADVPPLPDGAVLPEHLRLPDLTQTRTVDFADLDRWIAAMREAILWGPDERNGCHRVRERGDIGWLDADGEFHSPDEHTPAVVSKRTVEWHAHGDRHSTPGRPSLISNRSGNITWIAGWRLHRAHAPASIGGRGSHDHRWFWANEQPPGPLLTLLDTAWADQALTDAHAHVLLGQATNLPALPEPAPPHPPIGLPLPQQWLAHVIAANPSEYLSADLRTWCRLLHT